MKIRTIATLALALALGACASEEATDDAMADATPEASADAQAVTELAEYWATHYNMGHPGMVAGKYADEAWLLSSDGTLSEGSEAIETFLGSTAEMNPQVVITPGEVRVFGDQAVGVGMYEMTLSPEGAEPVSYGGSYMTHNVKVDGAWVIAGHIGNLTDDPFEGFEFSAPEGEAGENQGTMGELTGGWATHYNLGHASMVADYYTEDAMASLSRGGQVMGREAISTALSDMMEARPGRTVDINSLQTWELGDGWALDGGWFASTEAGADAPFQSGGYLNLLKQADDGSWQIHWGVSNAWPTGDM
ncbi:MAG: SgcJ/EcaC family oxidoreductase [Gemmatimonadales bacterium]|jgi:uncharacterized protein (TIGR02246 family)|nr:SgcJ/EcaC family oxidoreductase [Gemmatimonadales bacterium]MDG2239291.1 SgcJ/EcaC family oxidoreductase [Longimicrobiales bacterium]MBT3773060.1 SgcJ/EcaC family oxidoreductase [Gemmatimonadales bacterium]MBT3959147.1 SgcJ/EcaC family oxidoreductase [Gemmatimonadales bacterium]MBT4437274.1 SgcJ/EcaC family oxidoreductase [Gemmatimonadales bacterium]